MASTPHQTSVDMNALSSIITTINQRKPGICSFTWRGGTSMSSDCLPICIRMQPPPATSPQNLGKIILSLTFQAVLALFISPPTSSPPLLTDYFGAAMLISFAVSFAGFFLQNAFPRTALFFEKISALSAAIGVCIIASLLLTHRNFPWISWLACAFCLLAFIISFIK